MARRVVGGTMSLRAAMRSVRDSSIGGESSSDEISESVGEVLVSAEGRATWMSRADEMEVEKGWSKWIGESEAQGKPEAQTDKARTTVSNRN